MSRLVPPKQIALAIQGCRAIRAYEAIVSKALYRRLVGQKNQGFDRTCPRSVWFALLQTQL